MGERPDTDQLRGPRAEMQHPPDMPSAKRKPGPEVVRDPDAENRGRVAADERITRSARYVRARFRRTPS